MKSDHEYVVSRELLSLLQEGIETVIDSLEIISDPSLSSKIEKRIRDIKAKKVETKSIKDFKNFLEEEGIDVRRILDELQH